MNNKKYMKDVRKRFKKTRKKLDKTINDYAIKKFSRKFLDGYAFDEQEYLEERIKKSSSNNEEGIAKFEKSNNILDSGNNEEIITELEKIFLDKLNKLSINYLVLELGQYTRKTNKKTEKFTYFEVYNRYGITAILAKPDMSKEILIKELNLDETNYKVLCEKTKFASSFIKPLNKKKKYEQKWLEDYHFNCEGLFSNSDADAIISCPNPKLAFTIAGYAILAYLRCMYTKLFNNKVLALNIVTDENSANIVQKLIQKCFVNSGYNDNIGVITFKAKANTEIDCINCEGRCIVIEAMTAKSKDLLPSMLPEYFAYAKENTRNVEYPYSFMPIILSTGSVGNEFYTIEAKDLIADQEKWEKTYEAIHRFYKNPLDIKNTCIYNNATKEFSHVESVFKVFSAIYERKSLNNEPCKCQK